MTTVRESASKEDQAGLQLGLPVPRALSFEWPVAQEAASSPGVVQQPICLSGFLTEGQPDWLIGEPEAAPAPDCQFKRTQEQADTREESDQSREQPKLPPKLCENEYCQSAQGVKRYKDAKSRSYCRPCYENYREGRFCDFCLQIYSAAGQYNDEKEWVACDFCGRWNHTECEQRQRGRVIAHSYECLRCERAKSRPVRKAAKTVLSQQFLYEDVVKKKKCVEKSRNLALPSVPVFSRGTPVEENLGRIEQFLAGTGVKVAATEDEVRRDLGCLAWALQKEEPPSETGGKGGKRQRRSN